MDVKDIKKYILDNNLIECLLIKLGCHSIRYYTKEIRCALKDDDDNSKVSVFLNDEISVRIFTKGETVYGSIFDLIMYIYDISFSDACRKCSGLLGISFSFSGQVATKKHPLDFFRKIKRNANENEELKMYDISILNIYDKAPHIDLIRKDGLISLDILNKYHVKFDRQSNRILFPHFHYEDQSKIVGIIGRTVNPAFKELKIPKYFPIIPYEKSRNLYGLSHNREEIKKQGYVLIFEAEKSVIKADMFGYQTGVALGSHDLSTFQKKLLISLDVEIIICFDKDVEETHILNICNQLNIFRNVSYIKDKWNLIDAKDSPVDKGYKKWNYLFRNRIKV